MLFFVTDSYDSGESLSSDADETAEDQSALDDKIIEKAKACFQLAEESEKELRRLSLEDIEFSTGKQWPDNIQQERERDGRPCLVINRIPQFVQQITNDQRQNRPSIKVHPVGDDSDVETAKIIQGIVRHIEYNSNADVAYDTAFDFAARGGFGFFRVITDFVSPNSFDQDIFIKRVKNPFSVYLDPTAQEPDGSDANWGLIIDYLESDDYKEKYPDSELASTGDWQSIGNNGPLWMRDGSAAIAEYFYKEHREENLYLLSTGESILEPQLEKRLQEAQAAGIPVSVVSKRKTKIPTIKWVKLNAVEILERTDWPGKYIPIIPVYGSDIDVNGKRVLEGIVRNAKDSQRMYNYWKSAETEAIALAPRAPFVGAEGQFEGHEQEWKTANRRNHAFLEYKPTSLNGQLAPPPQRQTFEPAVQAISQASMMAADDLKATTGIYDASLGAQSQDTSGIAIQRRNNQAQTSNFHFIDNLTRSLRHTGRILVDLIPKIYDTARTSRIVGDDDTQKVVKVNVAHQDEDGKPLLYQLDAGTYDVTVDVGPSYASKRQEAAASMQSLAQSYPQIFGIAGDLFVRNMDWPGAQEIAERIKKTLPPNLTDDSTKGPQKIPPQVQAQMQQMGQMIDQLTSHLNQVNQVLETKKLDLEHKERIEFAKIDADIQINMAKLGSQEAVVLLGHQVAAINQRLKLLDMDEPIGSPDQLSAPQPQPNGAMGADLGQGAQPPTGGPPPG